MTVKELYEDLKAHIEAYPDYGNYSVGVVLSVPTIGGTPVAGIKSLSFGFDWDHGKGMLIPDKPLIEKTKYVKSMEERLDKLSKENYDLKRSK